MSHSKGMKMPTIPNTVWPFWKVIRQTVNRQQT